MTAENVKKDKKKLLESYGEVESHSHQFGPEEITEMNKELLDESITLFLTKEFDSKLLPIRARHLRPWWEEDEKTRMHARFCLPLTMASGLGYYILSPATFTIEWDGQLTHDCEVTIADDAASHTAIDNHSAFGAFTVQARFVFRTKNPGDFVYVKGISNIRRPFNVMEAMIESWWSPSEFGVVCLLNQAGKFTVKKGEPLAQFFCVSAEQAQYGLASVRGSAPFWQEWSDRRDPQIYDGRNMDYLRGVLPDQTPVCPHFKNWDGENSMSAAKEEKKLGSETSLDSLLDKAWNALNQNHPDQGERDYMQAAHLAEAQNEITEQIMNILYEAGETLLQQGNFKHCIRVFRKWTDLSERYFPPGLKNTADVLTTIAYAYRELGDFSGAEGVLKESLKRKRAEKTEPQSLAKTLIALGTLYDFTERRVEARPLLEEAKAIYEKTLPADDLEHLYLKNVYGCLLSHIGEYDQAFELFDEVVKERSRILGEDSLGVAFTYGDLGFHFKDLDDVEKSANYFLKCIENRKKHLPENDPQILSAMNDLAYLYRDKMKYVEAVKEFELLLAAQQKSLYPRDPQIKWTLTAIAECYKAIGKKDLYEKAVKQADQI